MADRTAAPATFFTLAALALVAGHGVASAYFAPAAVSDSGAGAHATAGAARSTPSQGPQQRYWSDGLPLTFGLNTATTTSPIEELPLNEAVQLIEEATTEEAARIFEETSTGKVVDVINELEIALSAEIWSQMEPVRAGEVMEELPTDWATEVVKRVEEERLVPRLPEISPTKLWQIPLEVFIDRLPSVPVMHLDRWNRPEVALDLPSPVGEVSDEATTVYTLPEARESEWAVLVNSPAPFEIIWAKFRQGLTDVRVRVENVKEPPAGVPTLPSGRIPNSFFNIGVENADPDDISVAAAIAFVDKEWLSANQVQKWSLQFNRFDDQLSTWVPHPSKRIWEDEERVFFAVVLPGFSKMAITGSVALPEQRFSVGVLEIVPEAPHAVEEVTISASVTNNGAERAVYPADLWVNKSIEDSQPVTLDPGEQARFSFTIVKPEGEYGVRVERELGSFTVAPAEPTVATPPATGGATLGPVGLALVVAAAAALILSGGYVMLRRPRSA